MGASNKKNIQANQDTKTTASTHANFSPPDVLLELTITSIGNSQTKKIPPRTARRVSSGACIYLDVYPAGTDSARAACHTPPACCMACFSTLAQESRRVTIRLNTGDSAFESGSAVK